MNQFLPATIGARAAASIALLAATCCAAWANVGTQAAPQPQAQLHIYSSQEMAALIKRPTSVADLLSNLKLAFDGDWLIQPAFYDRGNVLAFFNGTLVSRHPAIKGPAAGESPAFTTVESELFKGMTIKLTRGRIPVGKGVFTNSSYLEINVASVPNITAGIVKGIFGGKAKMFRTDVATDGGVFRLDSKYGLAYEGGNRARSSVEFFIKLDKPGFVEQADPPYPKQRDSDEIKKIAMSEIEREVPSNTDAR